MDDYKLQILQEEIRYLKGLLSENGIPYDFDEYRSRKAESPHSAVPLTMPEPTPEMAIQFYSMFRGRKDVYSRRSKKGYFPVCENFWRTGICPKTTRDKVKCQECKYKSYKQLKITAILEHLIGKREDCQDVIGLYPLFPDGTCWFMVFDFDNHDEGDDSKDWQQEMDALRRICTLNGIDALVERSRSGKGAHLWIFFEEAVQASKARRFGDALISRGSDLVSLKTFSYYDRMLPMQDELPKGGLGNLIAPPFQGRAVKKGNSVFVDEQWQPYADQWKKLMSTSKLSNSQIDDFLKQWCNELNPMDIFQKGNNITDHEEDSLLFETRSNHKAVQLSPEDATGPVRILLSDGIYIDSRNIKPRIQNAIRRIAAYSNPKFYQNLGIGISTKDTPRIVYCGYDEGNYIVIPRGCLEELQNALSSARIDYEVADKRLEGKHIEVSFNGKLYPEQQEAAEQILAFDNGILSAATAFGKTVVGAYLIGAKKVNTLILVHNVEIMQNWLNDLDKYLDIDEAAPTYTTPKGRIKRRTSPIGILTSQRNTLTGIIDVAMVSSLCKGDSVDAIVRNYGMVIMDECHHAAATTSEMVLRSVTAKYVYGLTATAKRDDGQTKKIFMLLGPVRHRYTTKQRASKQGIGHYVYPRFTRLIDLNQTSESHISDCLKMIAQSDIRNRQIIADAKACLQQGRTPVVMTKYKEHATILYDALQGSANHVFLLKGGGSMKSRETIRKQMAAVSPNESIAVVAIGQYIGEGFNFPRLDTLLLAMPISFSTSVEQYAGRLNRDYEGKKDVIIFDYIDQHTAKLERMYHKRLRTYKQIGFEVCPQVIDTQQVDNSIFRYEDYLNAYRTDLMNASHDIVISSPYMSSTKIYDLIEQSKTTQERGVKINVLTLAPESCPDDISSHHSKMIDILHNAGIRVWASEYCHEHFAIIDRKIVWYGSMNLLSKEKPDDNLMRVVSEEIAQELLELSISSLFDENLKK